MPGSSPSVCQANHLVISRVNIPRRPAKVISNPLNLGWQHLLACDMLPKPGVAKRQQANPARSEGSNGNLTAVVAASGFFLIQKIPMKTSAPLASMSPYFLSVLRLVSGALFVEHGTSKILGIPPHDVPLSSLAVFSGTLELVGGVLLVIGLFTRLAAFILSGEMAVAYFMVHVHGSFFPMVNKGELALLYCFVFLYLAAAGGGPWSLDRLRHRG